MVIDRYLMEITVKVLTCYLEIIRRHVNLGFVDIMQVGVIRLIFAIIVQANIWKFFPAYIR